MLLRELLYAISIMVKFVTFKIQRKRFSLFSMTHIRALERCDGSQRSASH